MVSDRVSHLHSHWHHSPGFQLLCIDIYWPFVGGTSRQRAIPVLVCLDRGVWLCGEQLVLRSVALDGGGLRCDLRPDWCRNRVLQAMVSMGQPPRTTTRPLGHLWFWLWLVDWSQ